MTLKKSKIVCSYCLFEVWFSGLQKPEIVLFKAPVKSHEEMFSFKMGKENSGNACLIQPGSQKNFDRMFTF